MKRVIKYFRGSILAVLLVAAATCSYGQVVASHVKAIPAPVNGNVANNTDINHSDTIRNSDKDNSIHEGKAPVALKRVAQGNAHPIHIPVMPKSSAVPAVSDTIKKDEAR
jgi:hypothetical protein